jgi:hypothetical protein
MAAQNRTSYAPIITITLDDGYSCRLNAVPFMNASGFIEGALRGKWLHAPDNKVHIPGLRQDLFLQFQTFAILGELSPARGPLEYYGRTGMAQAGKNDIEVGPWDVDIHHLLELFIVGDALQAPTFMNQVMTKLVSTYKRFYLEHEGRVPIGNVRYIFAESKNVLLRNFIVDVLLFALSDKIAHQAATGGRSILSNEVVVALRRKSFMTRNEVRGAPWDSPAEYQQTLLAPAGFI